jgi:hypothetical protein
MRELPKPVFADNESLRRHLRDGDIAYAIESAKDLLAQYDYVVLKAKSYRAAQQRQAIARAEAKFERAEAESTERWARTTLHNELRDLQARCTFLYGAAMAHGATAEELAGGWTVSGVNCPNGHDCDHV